MDTPAPVRRHQAKQTKKTRFHEPTGVHFRLAIWGESHGRQIGITLDGVMPGIPLSEEDFTADLERRRSGAAGTTARREADLPKIVSGVYEGYTTGAPLTIEFENTDTRSGDYSNLTTHFRPSHADQIARRKFGGFNDRAAADTSRAHHRGTCRRRRRGQEDAPGAGPLHHPADRGRRMHRPRPLRGGHHRGSQRPRLGRRHRGVPRRRAPPEDSASPFFDSAESMIAHALFSIPAVKGG